MFLILCPQKNIKHIQQQEKGTGSKTICTRSHARTHTPKLLIYYFVFVTCCQRKQSYVPVHVDKAAMAHW